METSSWRSLFSTSQPGIVPTVSQTPDETFVRRARLRSGRRRRRTDGTRPPQRCPRPQRQRANSANAKFISSHLRDRRRRRWERMLRATSKTESEVDPCGPTSQTSLYAKRKCEPIFHTPSRGEFPLASTLLTQPFSLNLCRWHPHASFTILTNGGCNTPVRSRTILRSGNYHRKGACQETCGGFRINRTG